MSSATFSKDVLKKALVANGLPISGSIDQMIARLQDASAAMKKKPGRKPKATKEDNKGNVAGNIDADELAFYAAEKPTLIALGITDPDVLNDELRRRYQSVKRTRTPLSKQQVTSTQAPKKKQKKVIEEEEEEEEGKGNLDCDQEFILARMCKKLSKPTIQSILSDFGEPTTGSKKTLAEEATLQLTMESDDEDDDADE